MQPSLNVRKGGAPESLKTNWWSWNKIHNHVNVYLLYGNQVYLKHHPDKGGDLEVFKIIRPATEALKLDEHACTFEGGRVPAWAKNSSTP